MISAVPIRNIMKFPTSRLLHAYWDRIRGERSAPERSEIEPGAIRNLLADSLILELAAAQRTATIRLAGTRLGALSPHTTPHWIGTRAIDGIETLSVRVLGGAYPEMPPLDAVPPLPVAVEATEFRRGHLTVFPGGRT